MECANVSSHDSLSYVYGPNPNGQNPPPIPLNCHSTCPLGSGVHGIIGYQGEAVGCCYPVRYFITCVDVYGNISASQTCEENNNPSFLNNYINRKTLFSFNCSAGQVATGVTYRHTSGSFDTGQGAITGILCAEFNSASNYEIQWIRYMVGICFVLFYLF